MGTVPVPAVERAGRARRAEQERLRARRSREAGPATAGRAFEEHVAGLRRRDGCADVRGIGGAGGPGADVTGTLPDGRGPAVRHSLGLGGIDLLGFWNGGTPLSSFLDLDIARSGTPRRLPRKR